MSFSGKVAIITGGSDGIGLATASLLAARGATVIICARRADKLEEARAAIAAAGGTVEAIRLDVSDSAAFAAMVADVAARHGRLDMMVNNAMSVHYAPITKLTLDQWRADFAINADAAFIGTKAYEIFKKERFGGDDTKIANSEAFKLRDEKDRAVFEREYERSSSLYFKGRPSLAEIIGRIGRDLERL